MFAPDTLVLSKNEMAHHTKTSKKIVSMIISYVVIIAGVLVLLWFLRLNWGNITNQMTHISFDVDTWVEELKRLLIYE